MAYIDTTVLISYYCPEKLSAQAEAILVTDDAPTISMLTVVELASALSRKIREKTLSPIHAETIVKQFDFHRNNHYFIVKPIDTSHYLKAATFIRQFNSTLRTLDALHLAVAVDDGLSLITADRQLASSAEKLGIECLLVE